MKTTFKYAIISICVEKKVFFSFPKLISTITMKILLHIVKYNLECFDKKCLTVNVTCIVLYKMHKNSSIINMWKAESFVQLFIKTMYETWDFNVWTKSGLNEWFSFHLKIFTSLCLLDLFYIKNTGIRFWDILRFLRSLLCGDWRLV